MKRAVVALVLVAAVVASGYVAWRWEVQTVSVVIVNESGRAADFIWQAWPLADEAVGSLGVCESRSVSLHGGASWRLVADGLEVGSAAFDIPLHEGAMAVEIWLEPGGSSRLVLPYPVTGPVDAPVPKGCGSAVD